MFEICQVVFSKLQELLKSESVPNKPPHLLCFTPGAKYVNALSFGTEHLVSDHALVVKRWLELLLSQHVYSQNKRGFWYNQLAMIETKYFKQFDAVSTFSSRNNNLYSDCLSFFDYDFEQLTIS